MDGRHESRRSFIGGRAVRRAAWLTWLVCAAGCRDGASATRRRAGGEEAPRPEGAAAEKGPDGQPILFWRIQQADRGAIVAMLDAGADIETQGAFGATPLLQAALIDDWVTVLLLLERGADPLVADRRGFTLNDLMHTSRVNPTSEYGLALQEVRRFLRRRGVSQVVFEPPRVREMLERGQWPPAR